MKKYTDALISELTAKGLSPATTCHRVNGKTTAIWHVDDDDDRYVEMTDAIYSDRVVLFAWDGLPGNDRFDVAVLSEHGAIEGWIRDKLVDMQSRYSPRGRNCLPHGPCIREEPR